MISLIDNKVQPIDYITTAAKNGLFTSCYVNIDAVSVVLSCQHSQFECQSISIIQSVHTAKLPPQFYIVFLSVTKYTLDYM